MGRGKQTRLPYFLLLTGNAFHVVKITEMDLGFKQLKKNKNLEVLILVRLYLSSHRSLGSGRMLRNWGGGSSRGLLI